MAVFLDNPSYLKIAFSPVIPATSEMTMMCWVYLPSIVVNYRAFVCVVGTGIAMETYTDGITSNFSTYVDDYLGPAFETGVWYHMAQTVISTSTTNHYIRGYLNGKMYVNVTNRTTFSDWSSCLVGCYEGYASYATATVKDVRLWRRALNEVEINNEMKNCRPYPAGLLLWSTFNDDFTYEDTGRYTWTAGGDGFPILAPVIRAGPGIPHFKTRKYNFI